ncbi:MAG: protein tyrosine phosphatase family protein [Pseudomonadota bacterium]
MDFCRLCCLMFLAVHVNAEEIVNYVEYSPSFASAGQPTRAQFESLTDRGFETVVYIAYSDHDNSLQNADRLAHASGLNYVHIPIDWNRPTIADYRLVSAVLSQPENGRTLLHCQLNYRASAFAMLYRVLALGVPLPEAKADMDAVWQPNATWTAFLRETLASNDVDPDCEGCTWPVEAD